MLLTRLAQAYAEKHALIQTGREQSLAAQRFQKDMQHKEILLHCIVHDLANHLTTIATSLALLRAEALSERGRQAVRLGLDDVQRQQRLIEQILETFAAEIGALQAFTADPRTAPDARACAQTVLEAMAPTAALVAIRMRLEPSPKRGADWRVVGERSRLERVLFNLVENALRHGPTGSTVRVVLARELSEVLIAVEDQGPGVPPEQVATLFEKFALGRQPPGRAGLGLYFCRLTVERWGGRIGYTPRLGGGCRFWVRLPRAWPGKRRGPPP